MRVVSGKARGRKLLSVPGDTTRPILDRVKTALFDILRPEIDGLKVLDLFGGSGSVGIEALSQGAKSCFFVDLERKAIQTIKKNLDITGFTAQSTVLLDDAFRFLKKTPETFDLIYVAPPQYKGLWEKSVLLIDSRAEILNQNGRVVIQIDPKEMEQLNLSALVEEDRRRYGSTVLIFLRKLNK